VAPNVKKSLLALLCKPRTFLSLTYCPDVNKALKLVIVIEALTKILGNFSQIESLTKIFSFCEKFEENAVLGEKS